MDFPCPVLVGYVSSVEGITPLFGGVKKNTVKPNVFARPFIGDEINSICNDRRGALGLAILSINTIFHHRILTILK